MTLDESVHGMRLRVIERAQVLGNVSAVCRELGISRTLFYRWRKRLERYGGDGVHPRRARGRAGRPVATPPRWSGWYSASRSVADRHAYLVNPTQPQLGALRRVRQVSARLANELDDSGRDAAAAAPGIPRHQPLQGVLPPPRPPASNRPGTDPESSRGRRGAMHSRKVKRRQDLERRQARRSPRRAAHEVRVGDQFEDREGAWHHRPPLAAAAGGPRNPVAVLDPRGRLLSASSGMSMPTYRPPPLPQSRKSTWTRYDAAGTTGTLK